MYVYSIFIYDVVSRVLIYYNPSYRNTNTADDIKHDMSLVSIAVELL